MRNRTTMLEQATYVYEHSPRMKREALIDSARDLGEWGIFSNRQIAAITGLRPEVVNTITGKTNRTGGALNVAELRAICRLTVAHKKGKDVGDEVRRILSDGTSANMLSRLSGIPQSTLSRWARTA